MCARRRHASEQPGEARLLASRNDALREDVQWLDELEFEIMNFLPVMGFSLYFPAANCYNKRKKEVT